MNIVDSSGWLEFFADGPNADDFSVPLSDTEILIVPSITVFEIFKVVLRERDEDSALSAVSLMRQGRIVDLSFELSIQAAKMSHEFRISMADSIILTTAYTYDATVWTQDSDFKGFQNVKYFPKISS
ncbi:MAG: type II toxin-antitoxin system VapC family toxin [Calditrichaeota bacterium]|jgi:toxin FitB|nr:type II toxin-antitoxin system VapC family toxin [Deltaproteobacteria bacterium]MBT7616545.1 type II toxin-antitoxin system VapC family toxin [Calditrichota bacterium]MBT4091977.1 type II toxin-antitoxin system VapC family toxin [Deltaproteobacteria bacterium]MBT4266776.1 type II toxin-antitoxin system VapC family toxin [Deltaproteobacteria bacterium]MBT4643740.1 type II toxin-antitoxin system VapC family toxin [Deltaproteobacteria bacterium]